MRVTVSEVQPAALKFSDSAACKTWVRGLPLTNVVHAQSEILDQVRRLNESPAIALERFKMLELMREPAVFVQTELAKKFSNKPLPLAEVERRSFQSVIELWKDMAAGYRLCVEACNNISPEDKETPKYTATMCHRVVACVASAITDFVRSNHQFPDGYWAELHAAYRQAEDFSVAEEKVPDPTSRER